MRLNGQNVVDNPQIVDSDKLKACKNPDHRVNGVIFDSYAPILVRFPHGGLQKPTQFDYLIGYERLKLVESGESPDVNDSIGDFFTPAGIRELNQLCAETAIDGMMQKVKAGQTRHILLNIQDLPCAAFPGGYLAVKKILETELANVKYKNLEGVVVFFPGANKQFRRAVTKQALNEMWLVYPNEDIEFHVVKGHL